MLAPRDPVVRHAWLFDDAWVEESVDDAHDEQLDFQKQAERIHELRTKAMMEIWSARGPEGRSRTVDGLRALGGRTLHCVLRSSSGWGVRGSADLSFDRCGF